MKYDFTTIIDRLGHDAVAVDGLGTGFAPAKPKEGFDPIPMWVADMNFATAPSVTAALAERLRHPIFSYYMTPQAYYDAIIRWQTERNGAQDLTTECIGYENGVLGGMVAALDAICSKGDAVLLHTPVYNGFVGTLKNNGYEAVYSPLVKDEQGVWRMDYADMERRLAKKKIHAAVLCSPHNPTGRVWERWELERAMELFRKYDVYVVSDEIWADLILTGHKHIPTQSVSEDAKQRTVALYAPSKTFNIAGLIGSYHIIYNKWLRDRVEKQSSLCHYNDMNVLSMHALLGAYTPEGAQWLEELRAVLTRNAAYAVDYIRTRFEGVEVAAPQGTYLIYIDCAEWCAAHGKTLEDVVKAGWEVGVAWADGRNYLGQSHIRINLALPFARVQEALERMDKYVFNA